MIYFFSYVMNSADFKNNYFLKPAKFFYNNKLKHADFYRW